MDDIIIRSALDIAIISLFYFAFKVWRKVWTLRNKPEAPKFEKVFAMDFETSLQLARLLDAANSKDAGLAHQIHVYQFIYGFILKEMGGKVPENLTFDYSLHKQATAKITVRGTSCP